MYEISTSKYLHIVLSIYFSVQNLTMATWGPKHVVVNSFPPTLFNKIFCCVYNCSSLLFLQWSPLLHTLTVINTATAVKLQELRYLLLVGESGGVTAFFKSIQLQKKRSFTLFQTILSHKKKKLLGLVQNSASIVWHKTSTQNNGKTLNRFGTSQKYKQHKNLYFFWNAAQFV